MCTPIFCLHRCLNFSIKFLVMFYTMQGGNLLLLVTLSNSKLCLKHKILARRNGRTPIFCPAAPHSSSLLPQIFSFSNLGKATSWEQQCGISSPLVKFCETYTRRPFQNSPMRKFQSWIMSLCRYPLLWFFISKLTRSYWTLVESPGARL